MKRIREFDAFIAGGVARIPHGYRKLLVVMTVIGSFGLVIFTGALVAGLAYLADNYSVLPSLITVLLLVPLAEMIKLLTRRQRPKTLYVQHMRFRTYSFPSHHAYVSALMCGYLLLLAGSFVSMPLVIALGIVLALMVAAIGVSRVYLGAHFPSDILAGWILAIAVLTMSLFLGGGFV